MTIPGQVEDGQSMKEFLLKWKLDRWKECDLNISWIDDKILLQSMVVVASDPGSGGPESNNYDLKSFQIS